MHFFVSKCNTFFTNLHMTTPTGKIALTDSFPVEVLMKSDPAIMQTKEALYTLLIDANSP